MNRIILNSLACLADSRFSGSRISDVRWVEPGGLWLGFGRGSPGIVLSTHPAVYGLFSVWKDAVRVMEPPDFVQMMRRFFKGRCLTGISAVPMERIVRLTVEDVSPSGKVRTRVLIFESMSRWSNLILVEGPREVVLTTLKMIRGGDGKRAILPGRSYEPPPLPGGSDPGAHKGFGGQFAQEPGDLLKHVGDLPTEGTIACGEDGCLRMVPLLPGLEASERGEARDLLDLSGEYYLLVAHRLHFDKRAALLAKELGRARKQSQTLMGRLRADFRETELADDYQRWGTAVIAHLKEIDRGAKQFTPRQVFGRPGRQEIISLEPRLSPVANAERYFRKARKMRARARHLKERLEELAKKIDNLKELQEKLEQANDGEDLEKLGKAAAKIFRLQPREDQPDHPPRKKRGPRPYLEYISGEGHRILIGRNAASNDYILNRMSSPDDLWCHAEGYSGAHVIVKGYGKKPEKAVIEEACMLAAHFSKGKDQAKVTVSYTRRKYVRKPKGARPGLVVLRQRKTMVVTPALPGGGRFKEGKA